MKFLDKIDRDDLVVLPVVVGSAVVGIAVTLSLIHLKPDMFFQAIGIGLSVTGIMIALKGVISSK